MLRFRAAYKPDRVYHLGDFTDQAAFRNGAQGSPDECVSITEDLFHGKEFLENLQPTHVCNGNHEIRLWEMMNHPNEIKARAAKSVVQEIREVVAKCGAQYIEGYDIGKDWFTLGNYKLYHGWMFNDNSVRDHAEHFGNSIMAHLHIASIVPGRRSDNPQCYCVGTLANIPAMHYASRRRATSRWSHGFVFGEYDERTCYPQLSQCRPGEAKNWSFPL